jgi:hypothetical protein
MRRPMTMSGDVIGEIENHKYLGSFVQKDGGFSIDIKHRIKCSWMKWREASGVSCDKRIPIRLKGKFYMSDQLCYMVQCWVVNRKIKQIMNVADMKMLKDEWNDKRK